MSGGKGRPGPAWRKGDHPPGGRRSRLGSRGEAKDGENPAGRASRPVLDGLGRHAPKDAKRKRQPGHCRAVRTKASGSVTRMGAEQPGRGGSGRFAPSAGSRREASVFSRITGRRNPLFPRRKPVLNRPLGRKSRLVHTTPQKMRSFQHDRRAFRLAGGQCRAGTRDRHHLLDGYIYILS